MITLENPNLLPNEIVVPDPSSYELTANHPDDISSMSDIPNLSSKLNAIQEREPFNKNAVHHIHISSKQYDNHHNNNFNFTLNNLSPSQTHSPKKSRLTDPFNQTAGEHLSKRLKQNSSHGRKLEEEEEGVEGGGDMKEELLETFKKKKEMIENNESEKNSVSSTTLISSKKFLKNTILLEYVPKSFDYLKYCLMASICFIYLSQILNVVFITEAYTDLQDNFNHDFQYDEITPYLFRILRSSYKLCLIDSAKEKDNLMNLVRTLLPLF